MVEPEGVRSDGAAPVLPELLDAVARLSMGDGRRDEAAEALAAVAHRAASALHRLARAEAAARRDDPSWGAWAALANAARDAVLKLAAVRRTAADVRPGE